MAFIDLYTELVGRLPGLSPFLAETFVQRAWESIRDERNWSFLSEVCSIYCPTQVTTGSVAIVQFSRDVTCDAAASAALSAVTLPSGLSLSNLQIRFGGSGNTSYVGQVYSIVQVDTTIPTALVLTLDREVIQQTNAGAGYQVYRAYVIPTVDSFLKWTSMVDMTNGWRLKLNWTSVQFDGRDPQRMAQSLAYYLGAFKGNPGSQPRPQYELWPHPVQGQQFFGRFQARGDRFVTGVEELPPLISEEMIMSRALGYSAYPWAFASQSTFPALKGPSWLALALDEKKHYQELLLTAKRLDNEQELTDVWNRGHGLIHSNGYRGMKGMWDFPIDANFMQSHLINF